jgi:DNA polymerase sigma
MDATKILDTIIATNPDFRIRAERCARSHGMDAHDRGTAHWKGAAGREITSAAAIVSVEWLRKFYTLASASGKAAPQTCVFAAFVPAPRTESTPDVRAVAAQVDVATARDTHGARLLSSVRVWRRSSDQHSGGTQVLPLAIDPSALEAARGATLLDRIANTIASEIECVTLKHDVLGERRTLGVLCIFTLGAFVAYRLRDQIAATVGVVLDLDEESAAMGVFSKTYEVPRGAAVTYVEELVSLRAAWERASAVHREAMAPRVFGAGRPSVLEALDDGSLLLARLRLERCDAAGAYRSTGSELGASAYGAKVLRALRRRAAEQVAERHAAALLEEADAADAKTRSSDRKRESKRRRKRAGKKRRDDARALASATANATASAIASAAADAARRAFECAHSSAAARWIYTRAVSAAVRGLVARAASDAGVAAAFDAAAASARLARAATLVTAAVVLSARSIEAGFAIAVTTKLRVRNASADIGPLHAAVRVRSGYADVTPSLLLVGLAHSSFARRLRRFAGRASADLQRLRLCSRGLNSWLALDRIAEWALDVLPRLNAVASRSSSFRAVVAPSALPVPATVAVSTAPVATMQVDSRESGRSSGAAVTACAPAPVLRLGKHRVSSALVAQLSADVADMSNVIDLMAKEQRPFKMSVVNAVRVAISSLWPASRVEVFGSFAVGLGVPGSDVDLVVCDVQELYQHQMQGASSAEISRGHIKRIATHLGTQSWIKQAKPVSAAIPIVKCNVSFSEAGAGGIALDVSLDGPSHRGVATCALVRRMITNYDELVPLVRVLKQWLLGLGLNDPYTGGLSSWGLVLMVVSFLQQQRASAEWAVTAYAARHQAAAADIAVAKQKAQLAGSGVAHSPEPLWTEEWEVGRTDEVRTEAATVAGPVPIPNLGVLLLGFLHTFGEAFDPSRRGVRSTGPLFDRRARDSHKLDPLVLEDPFDPSNNVGRGCFAIRTIQTAFSQALSNIIGGVPRRPRSLVGGSPRSSTPLVSPRAGARASGDHGLGEAASPAAGTSVLGRLFGAEHHRHVLALANRLWAPPSVDGMAPVAAQQSNLVLPPRPGELQRRASPLLGVVGAGNAASDNQVVPLAAPAPIAAAAVLRSMSPRINVAVRDSCELLRALAAEMLDSGKLIASRALAARIVSIAVDIILNYVERARRRSGNESRRTKRQQPGGRGGADALLLATSLACCADDVRAAVVDGMIALAFRPLIAMASRDVLMREPSSRIALKLIGGMIGSLTVALSKPLLFRTLSIKSLLASPVHCRGAIPAVCKLLERCTCSLVFRLPNPWTSAILAALRDAVGAHGVPLSLRFEVEVLTKTLQRTSRIAQRGSPPRSLSSGSRAAVSELPALGEVEVPPVLDLTAWAARAHGLLALLARVGDADDPATALLREEIAVLLDRAPGEIADAPAQ